MVLGILALLATVGGLAYLQWWRVRQGRIPAPKPLTLLQEPDTDLRLTRLSPTQLEIAWTNVSAKTSLALSLAADDFSAAQTYETTEQTLCVDVLPEQRYYLRIRYADGSESFMAERFIPMQNLPNFRDVGGYRTHEGRRVRWNRVYRASALDQLHPTEQERLIAMGVQVVCDLRTPMEANEEPDKLPQGIRYYHFPIMNNDSRLVAIFRLLFDKNYLPNLLLHVYTRVTLDDNGAIIGAVFRQIAEAENLPLLLHCSAGKDRTGLTSALLLSFLGVPEATIIADYTLSNHHYDFFRVSARRLLKQVTLFGISEEDYAYLLIADANVLQGMFDYLRAHYGTVENYLKTAAQLDDTLLARVQANLLE